MGSGTLTPSLAIPAGGRVPQPGYTLLSLGHRHVKWGSPSLGTGAVIRYAFLTTPVEREGAFNCGELDPVSRRLPRSELNPAQFEAEVRKAMAEWEAIANIRFEPARDQATADLLIGMQQKARGIAYADVLREAGPPGTTVAIRQAAVCFNPELAWENRFDGDSRTPDVRYVAGHELGHVLGLDHTWRPNRLMNFKYHETIRAPQSDDAAGAIRLYGRVKDNSARIAFTSPATEPVAARPRPAAR